MFGFFRRKKEDAKKKASEGTPISRTGDAVNDTSGSLTDPTNLLSPLNPISPFFASPTDYGGGAPISDVGGRSLRRQLRQRLVR